MKLLLCGSFEADEREAWAQALRAALPGHTLVLAPGPLPDDSIEAAIVANPPPGRLQGLPRLRLIQSLWAGVDRLLADTRLPPQVPIARMVDPAMNQAMAETALWACLSVQRGFFQYQRQQQAGQWRPLPQHRADEWPVLVLGAGQMGAHTATGLVRQGYPVQVWRRRAGAATGWAGPVLQGAAALGPALGQAALVVNLLPLTVETRGLIDDRFLAAMRPGASLLNLARGAHVVDADLLAALDRGHVGHAVLDVFHTEPLPADHPYWRHPRVTVLPHAAAQTDARSAAAVVAHNIEALARGAPLAHLVAREAGY